MQKFIWQQLDEIAHLPFSGYAPEIYHAGVGLGSAYYRSPDLLHSNGFELESFLRGTGSKGLEHQIYDVTPSVSNAQGTLHMGPSKRPVVGSVSFPDKYPRPGSLF